MKARNKYLIGFFLLIISLTLLAIYSVPDSRLHLIACDVGQGDAILATYKSTQMLVDGGPDRRVLDCLSRHMSFWDRKIEVVILTHPQLDHFSGLIDVIKRYKVDLFVGNAVDNSTQSYRVLKNLVGSKGIRVINPREGLDIRLGSMFLDIVNPIKKLLTDEPIENKLGTFTTNKDLNDFSVVGTLSFGNFNVLLTGDIGPNMIDEITATGKIHKVEVLKVPHHGSKNGLTEKLLEVANPDLAIISVGAKNSFGHPSPEVLKLLSDKAIKTLRTDQMGDVEVISDGKRWWLK
ncbi:hypothetical protein A3D00_03050 [Candidatus Woesebacteria bacterium RIFCSPHIGHO2_02_FULL_38_9]|uniref:Metallo-beta-lactamase domain-containing protein n=1 Tax=Candidatus Woesebacteria bacterium RIFCSPHIGHO2_01_FULL_39_28 TaxID=1802496 RepID=A0A1F7YF06_9BACT|nr:MAG: hypothetical protein A2627_02780 [Candidatus Woesebacteria bacterium RIFCSPHIGHO2_01_FULL_39_28]OGM34663.1 MAG: hypothetical protein A3D00_03050 [Candidatus Woesebacteria bacterium RIFCSPHIGHO2_02_FULL_38_9]OGM58591.1 MAG: hypothetical protein A3A50_00920 [Candidatus Woesebacteria bacterium RIFCSPLOWO2_01_FULL_38_20]